MSYETGERKGMIKNSTSISGHKAHKTYDTVEVTDGYEYQFIVSLSDKDEDSVPNVYVDSRLENDTEKEVRCLKAMLEAIQFRLCYLGAISEEDLMKQLGVED